MVNIQTNQKMHSLLAYSVIARLVNWQQHGNLITIVAISRQLSARKEQ
jgi:hypothetical protein